MFYKCSGYLFWFVKPSLKTWTRANCALHLDTRCVICCQLIGRKRWGKTAVRRVLLKGALNRKWTVRDMGSDVGLPYINVSPPWVSIGCQEKGWPASGCTANSIRRENPVCFFCVANDALVIDNALKQKDTITQSYTSLKQRKTDRSSTNWILPDIMPALICHFVFAVRDILLCDFWRKYEL